MAHSHSLASANRRRRIDLTTKGSAKKRSVYDRTSTFAVPQAGAAVDPVVQDAPVEVVDTAPIAAPPVRRKKSQAERERMLADMGLGHRIINRTPAVQAPRSAQEAIPGNGAILTDPATGLQVRSLGPQPMNLRGLERAGEGQPTLLNEIPQVMPAQAEVPMLITGTKKVAASKPSGKKFSFKRGK